MFSNWGYVLTPIIRTCWFTYILSWFSVQFTQWHGRLKSILLYQMFSCEFLFYGYSTLSTLTTSLVSRHHSASTIKLSTSSWYYCCSIVSKPSWAQLSNVQIFSQYAMYSTFKMPISTIPSVVPSFRGSLRVVASFNFAEGADASRTESSSALILVELSPFIWKYCFTFLVYKFTECVKFLKF